MNRPSGDQEGRPGREPELLELRVAPPLIVAKTMSYWPKSEKTVAS